MTGQPRGGARTLLARYLWPRWRHVLLLVVLLLATIGLQLVGPQMMRAFIDRAKALAPLGDLLVIAGLYFGIAAMMQACSIVETYVSEQVGWSTTNSLRSDLALHCLHLDMSFHKEHTAGELIERIDGDVTALANFFSRFIIYIVGSILLLLGVLAVLFRTEWRVGLTMTGFVSLAFVAALRLRHVAVPQWGVARQASATLYGFIEERLAGTEDIRASGATAYTMSRLYGHMREVFHAQRWASLLGVSSWGSQTFLFGLGLAATVALSGWLYLHGALTIGTVYLIIAYTQMLQRPIDTINRQMQDFQRALASVGRVTALLNEQRTLLDGHGVTFPTDALSVELDHISFGYTPGEMVLRDVSFHLTPGQVLGVLGRTGSGKTTISRLLLRLYDPALGIIRLGEIDILQAKIADLRLAIGMVTQDVQLFHATLRDNLTFFDRSILDPRIIAVLHDLGLGQWLATLPDGLDSILPPGGGGLSAGEGQLLAFARVFLRDPGLVILDEASSRLDPATEARIERAVDRLLTGRTGIIIAHRLQTVQRADTILVLEDGRVVEYGARERLARDGASRFAALLHAGSDAAHAGTSLTSATGGATLQVERGEL